MKYSTIALSAMAAFTTFTGTAHALPNNNAPLEPHTSNAPTSLQELYEQSVTNTLEQNKIKAEQEGIPSEPVEFSMRRPKATGGVQFSIGSGSYDTVDRIYYTVAHNKPQPKNAAFTINTEICEQTPTFICDKNRIFVRSSHTDAAVIIDGTNKQTVLAAQNALNKKATDPNIPKNVDAIIEKINAGEAYLFIGESFENGAIPFNTIKILTPVKEKAADGTDTVVSVSVPLKLLDRKNQSSLNFSIPKAGWSGTNGYIADGTRRTVDISSGLNLYAITNKPLPSTNFQILHKSGATLTKENISCTAAETIPQQALDYLQKNFGITAKELNETRNDRNCVNHEVPLTQELYQNLSKSVGNLLEGNNLQQAKNDTVITSVNLDFQENKAFLPPSNTNTYSSQSQQQAQQLQFLKIQLDNSR